MSARETGSSPRARKRLAALAPLPLLGLNGTLVLYAWLADPHDPDFTYYQEWPFQAFLLLVFVLTPMVPLIQLLAASPNESQRRLVRVSTFFLLVWSLVVTGWVRVSYENLSEETWLFGHFWMIAASVVFCFLGAAVFVVGDRMLFGLSRVTWRVASALGIMRSLLPVFLTAFLLSTLSSDVHQATEDMSVWVIFGVSLASVLATSMASAEIPDSIVVRVFATAAVWVVFTAVTFALSAHLLTNDVLTSWGANVWQKCTIYPSDVPLYEQVDPCGLGTYLIPRLKLACLLGCLGTMAVLAQSIIPPRVKEEA